MQVDGEDELQGSKRKRGDERDREYSDGEDEKEDEDDEAEEERRVKRPRAGESKRRIPVGTGRYYNPPCKPCEQNGTRCEKQKKAWACCRCAVKKVACRRGQSEGGRRRNARSSGEDDGDDEPQGSDMERPARQPVAVPVKGADRKGKAKGNFLVCC
jgi:hypothetical protein